jgi:hypothetical protein
MAKKANNPKDYRAERKARIAKKSKKTKIRLSDDQLDKLGKVLGYVFGIGIVVALIAGLFSHFGVVQKLTTAVKVEDKKYSVAEYNYFYTAVFLNTYNQAYSYDSQYGEGMGKLFSGYDITVSPDLQTTKIEDLDHSAEEGTTSSGEEGTTSATTTEKTEKTVTYTEFFHEQTVEAMEQQAYYLKKAAEAGIEFDDDMQADVDEQIETLKGYADSNKYSLSRYIALQYGKGLNEKMVRKILEEQAVVTAYLEDRDEKLGETITDEEIEAVFNEDPSKYQVVNLRIFAFPLEASYTADSQSEPVVPDYTDDEQRARANEFVSRLTDEKSFIELTREYAPLDEQEILEDENATEAAYSDKEMVKNNVNEEAADWAFSAQANEYKAFETDTYIYVLYVKKAAFRNEETLKNVRHILVKYDSDEASIINDLPENANYYDLAIEYANNGIPEDTTGTSSGEPTTGVTDSEEILYKQSQYLEKVGRIISQYLTADEQTEEVFATLADENSDDTYTTKDGGGETSGGLIEKVGRGAYVPEFEAWCYDENRQPGEIGVIKSDYGYHIMYFVSAEKEPEWKATIRAEKVEKLNKGIEETDQEAYKDTAKVTFLCEKWAFKKAEKFVIEFHERINKQ